MSEVQEKHKNTPVARWLMIGVLMILIQILLGGITRLTGSGLSITEWKPILGALPPMNEQDWNLAFDKYKQIGQYRYLNADFTLGQFKFIYFWEWLHRNWARFMGLVFIVPFIYFLVKGYIHKKMILPFAGIFVLGALQGAVGFIMVASGVNPDALYVSHIKLALHFIAALLLLVFIFWFALQLTQNISISSAFAKYKKYTILLIVLLTLQLVYGAFLAGLKAASAAPTWPSINGDLLPETVLTQSWLFHPIAVQFVHRGLAYLIFTILLILVISVSRNQQLSKANRKAVYTPFVLVISQIILGITAIFSSPFAVHNGMGEFEMAAIVHQLCAVVLLMALVRLWYYQSRPIKA